MNVDYYETSGSKEPKIEIRRIDEESAYMAAVLERIYFPHPWSEKAILEEAARGYFIAAYFDGVFAGYAGMTEVLDECGICNIAVMPEFRRHGVGEVLVADLIRRAKEKHAFVIMLEVRRSNIPAIKLYEKMGFELVGERKNFYDKPKEDALLYNFYLHSNKTEL